MNVRAAPSPWEPSLNEVFGFEHQTGGVMNFDHAPILTGVNSWRYDFWKKSTSEKSILTLCCTNDTNVFEQAADSDLATTLESLAAVTDGLTFTGNINSLFDLLTGGMRIVTFIARSANISDFYLKELTWEDYPYLDVGTILYSSEITIGFMEDENLAVIAATFSADFVPETTSSPIEMMNDNIDSLNSIINSLLGIESVNIPSSSNSPQSASFESLVPRTAATDDLDVNVEKVFDEISFQYGTNNHSQSSIPGYPIWLIGIASILGIRKIKTRFVYKRNRM